MKIYFYAATGLKVRAHAKGLFVEADTELPLDWEKIEQWVRDRLADERSGPDQLSWDVACGTDGGTFTEIECAMYAVEEGA
jgi:hypothetical protein